MTQISEGIGALDAGDTHVVPSVQRALALKLRIASEAARAGQLAWRTPPILAWSTWLERYARRGASVDLLPELEEWLVFRDCARRAWNADGDPSAALIESLRRAARLVFDWQLPERSLAGTPEAEWLARTIRDCDELCAERRALPRYRLSAIAASKAATDDGRYGRAHLTGFVVYTAAQRALLATQACREGPRLLRPSQETATRRGVAAEETAAEFTIAAAWARARLESDPRARILVLVPELRRREQEVLRAFGQALSPSAWLGEDPLRSTLLGLEGGRGLADFPIVQSRFALLRRPDGVVSARALLQWLRGVCSDPEADAAFAHLDRWLRASLDADTTEENLERLLQGAPAGLRQDAQLLGARLALLRATRWEASEPLRFWIETFRALWRLAFSPLQAALGSAEQQVVMRLDTLLDELSQSVSQLRRFDGHGAAALLAAAAARTRFEPASGDASVTLSASLGAPIVDYDGIWVCGLDAGTWPAPPRLDAFIPAALQRAAGMPQTNAAQLARAAEASMQTWADSTRELVLSRPRFEDGVERQESEIAARFLGAPGFVAAKAGRSLAAQLHRPNRVERFDDERGLALARGADIPRGTRALQLQAQCAFNAYAQLRLHAVPIEENRAGIDPRERGRLLHLALEFLWKDLGSGAGLHAAQSDLTLRIERAIDAAEAELGWQKPGHLSQRHRARERRRLAALLAASCEADVKRPRFLDVHCESPRELVFAGSRLRLRIDRMDRLANGHVAIFDYKSGQAMPPKLSDERLVDPQLPIYAVAATEAGETVDAVALAFLTRGSAKLRGLTADQSALKVKISPDWDGQLARWKAQLDALAADFLSGHALRDPSDGACRYCHLQVFCRIAAIAEEPEAFEEEIDDGAD